MMLDELILTTQKTLLEFSNLDTLCYYYIKHDTVSLGKIDISNLNGEVEKIAVFGFLSEYVENEEIDAVKKRLHMPSYKRSLNIYSWIGLYLQSILNDSNTFENYIEDCFNNHSLKYKYLLFKVFPNKFEQKLIIYLQTFVETKEIYTLLLQHCYLSKNINKTQIIVELAKETNSLDIIDLLILEDLQNINAVGYSRQQEELLSDILWMAVEIQSKHKIQNNSEDQYNSLFQSLLSAKGYTANEQTQRGVSSSEKQAGELDILIFSQEKLPLSIFEAFKLSSIDTATISQHLKKLSENYDPNGLRINYVVVYAKDDNFVDLWRRYLEFVPTVTFDNITISSSIQDITARYPNMAGIKIGLIKYNNRDAIVQVYHLFMNMNFI